MACGKDVHVEHVVAARAAAAGDSRRRGERGLASAEFEERTPLADDRFNVRWIDVWSRQLCQIEIAARCLPVGESTPHHCRVTNHAN